MEKIIEDYLRLYWHCDAWLKRNNSEHIHEGNVNDLLQSNNNHSIEYIKPILRPLSDMTEEEKEEFKKLPFHLNDEYGITKQRADETIFF